MGDLPQTEEDEHIWEAYRAIERSREAQRVQGGVHDARMQYASLILPDQRPALERVSSAKTVEMTAEDLDHVEGLYQSAWLKDDDIRLYLNGDEEAFRQRIERGVMIFGFNEQPVDDKGKAVDRSVREQMQQDLLCPPHGGKYRGALLRDAVGALLAFATWQEPPVEPDPQYIEYFANRMQFGVTGEMEYHVTEPSAYVRQADATITFDTVVQAVPFAASRLFHDITEDMARNPRYQHFLLYHLQDVRMSREGKELGKGFQQTWNWGSHRFFVNRKCHPIATDKNTLGPGSNRIIDGSTIRVLPIWGWMYGPVKDVRSTSRSIWERLAASPRNGGEST